MAKIQDSTKYSEIRIGDELPGGLIVNRIIRNNPGTRSESVKIAASRGPLGRGVTFGFERGSDTYGQSVARANAMHELEDHS